MAPKFVRSTIQKMAGYAPGEQPAPGTRIIKLNTNENPFPPSPKVMEAIAKVPGEHLRRYPDPMSRSFCAAAGKVLGDGKMQAEGAAEKVEGKVQNAVGGAKDALREADRRK